MRYSQLVQEDSCVATISLIGALAYGEDFLCIAALSVLILRKQWQDYKWVGYFLAVRFASDILLDFAHSAAGHLLSAKAAYELYFYAYEADYAVESLLTLLIVYGVFKLAMAPLKGLQTLGMLIFKWAAGISVAVSLGSVYVPHVTGAKYAIAAISQLQRTQSILTLSLLVFVFFAIRPMGLSYKSRIFGVSLGLCMMSLSNLLQSTYDMVSTNMHSDFSAVSGCSICVILAIWICYFAMPEPKRRMIVLPTTSPFLRWNQISQALGDDPGFVAVGGVPPEMFATAELEVMRRASLKMPAPVAEFPVSSLSEERLSASRAI
jgi:hypothetical protein